MTESVSRVWNQIRKFEASDPAGHGVDFADVYVYQHVDQPTQITIICNMFADDSWSMVRGEIQSDSQCLVLSSGCMVSAQLSNDYTPVTKDVCLLISDVREMYASTDDECPWKWVDIGARLSLPMEDGDSTRLATLVYYM
jgi:hypothetical protein